MRTKMRLTGAAIACLGAVALWLTLAPEAERERAAEREVREFLRELERDLQRNFRPEMLTHLVHEDPRTDEFQLDERAHAVIDALNELTEWRRVRISGVRLSISGEEALVELTVQGEAADPNGHFHPATKALFLRLRKFRDAWKIVDLLPRPPASGAPADDDEP